MSFVRVGWRYRELVDKHTGDPKPGEIQISEVCGKPSDHWAFSEHEPLGHICEKQVLYRWKEVGE